MCLSVLSFSPVACAERAVCVQANADRNHVVLFMAAGRIRPPFLMYAFFEARTYRSLRRRKKELWTFPKKQSIMNRRSLLLPWSRHFGKGVFVCKGTPWPDKTQSARIPGLFSGSGFSFAQKAPGKKRLAKNAWQKIFGKSCLVNDVWQAAPGKRHRIFKA